MDRNHRWRPVILNIRISQFKILGVALETIAEATGLTMEQVEAL